MSFHKRKHCILSGSDYLYSNHHNKQYIYLQILGIYKYHIMYIYIFLLVIWSSMANFTTTFILHSVIPWNNTDTKAFALIVRWWLILLQTMQSVHRDTQTLNYFGWLLLFKNRQHCLPSKEIAVFVQQWHLPLSNSYKIWLRVNKSFCLKYSYWVHRCYNIAS